MNMKTLFAALAGVAAVLGVATTSMAENFEAAGCLVFEKDASGFNVGVLVAKNRYSEFAFLMARPVGDETDPRATAARAAKEEAGLDVTVGKEVQGNDGWAYKNPGKKLFVCEATSSFEVAGLKTKDSNRVKKLVMLDPHSMKGTDGTDYSKVPFRGGYEDQRFLINSGFIP